jgi:hypothetical protein
VYARWLDGGIQHFLNVTTDLVGANLLDSVAVATAHLSVDTSQARIV